MLDLLEAFLARKAVVTATDSGGPNEFVIDGVNGFCCAPEPEAFAAAINALHADPRRARSLGEAGEARARTITWDGVIEKLVGAGEDGMATGPADAQAAGALGP